jgi:DNA primase
MPGIDFNRVKQLISMDNVLHLIQWKSLRGCGGQDRGPCPNHRSSAGSRSFSVDRRGNRFQCFKCGAKGNHLDLYAKVSRLDLYSAASELCRSMSLDVPYLQRREQRRGTSN